MALKGTWIDRVDEVDDILAEDINKLAHSIIYNEDSIAEILDITAQQSETARDHTFQIKRNAKRITNLEHGISADLFITDENVAYIKDVPATALPYAELKKVGGMTYKDETIKAFKNAKVTKIKSIGANILNIHNIVNGTTATTTIVTNDSFKVEGTRTAIGMYWIYNLTAGDKYYISWESTRTGNSGGGISMQLYTSDGVALSSGLWLQNTLSGSGSYTIPENASYMRVLFYGNNGLSTSSSATFSNVMLTKNISLPYSRYVEHSLVIPDAVQDLESYGYGYNKTYCNYINWQDRTYHQYAFIATIDGSIGSVIDSTTGTYAVQVSELLPFKICLGGLCDKYDNATSSTEEGIYTTYTDTFYITDHRFTNTDTAKALLAATPVTICCYGGDSDSDKFNEVTDISDIITDDNFIEVEGGGTIMAVNEHELKAFTEITYMLKEETT